MQWFTLIGIAAGDASRPALVKGNMQLYSVAQQRSQALEAHMAAFDAPSARERPKEPVGYFCAKDVASGRFGGVEASRDRARRAGGTNTVHQAHERVVLSA